MWMLRPLPLWSIYYEAYILKIIIKFIYILFTVTNINYLLADNNKLKDYILELDTQDFNKKVITIEKISQIKTDLSLRTLKNIMEGRLFIRKVDSKII